MLLYILGFRRRGKGNRRPENNVNRQCLLSRCICVVNNNDNKCLIQLQLNLFKHEINITLPRPPARSTKANVCCFVLTFCCRRLQDDLFVTPATKRQSLTSPLCLSAEAERSHKNRGSHAM